MALQRLGLCRQDLVGSAETIDAACANLRTMAPGVAAGVKAASVTPFSAYCIQDTEGSTTYHYEGGTAGPATIAIGACPASYGTVT